MPPQVGRLGTSGLYYSTDDTAGPVMQPTGMYVDGLGIHIYNGGVEVGRFGNLDGYLSTVGQSFGIGIGSLNGGYLGYDPVRGLKIKGTVVTVGVFPNGYDIWDEPLRGTPNGVQTEFEMANQPVGQVQITNNGVWLQSTVAVADCAAGNLNDDIYTLFVPQVGDNLTCNCIDLATMLPAYNVSLGTPDGSNRSFRITTFQRPVQGSMEVFLNGAALDHGSDYLETGVRGVIFNTSVVPQLGDVLRASYITSANPKFNLQEVPTGAINGVNTVYTLAHNYVAGTPIVVLNGIKQTITNDYTESGANQLTFTFATQPGDHLYVTYLQP